jgi:hypothetical protein
MPKSLMTEFTERNEFERAVDMIRFGHPAAIVGRGTRADACRVYGFLPGENFCIVWQRWHDPDQQHRAIAFVQALNEASQGFRLPGLSRPIAVHAIVDQEGPAGQGGAVDRILSLLESIERVGIDLATLPSAYWRLVSYQVLLQEQPAIPPVPPKKAA